jgi:uncharacterized protein
VIKKVSFQSEGRKISGRLVSPEGDKHKFPAVIFYHGTPSDQTRFIPRAQYLADRGILAMTMDYGGFGESEGEYSELTLKDVLKDALAGLDFLIKQPNVDPLRVGVCGRSTGGYVAALVSAQKNIKSLILAAPALFEESDGELSFERLDKKDEEKILFRTEGSILDTSPIEAIRKFEGSLLIIRHELDELIPERIIKMFYENAVRVSKKEVRVFKGVGHRVDESREKEFRDLVRDWFLETL